MIDDDTRLRQIRQRWGTERTGRYSLATEAQDYADVLWLVDALTAAQERIAETDPTACPRCGGVGIVDTSPPGVEAAPWLATDTDCPRCLGEGVIEDNTQPTTKEPT